MQVQVLPLSSISTHANTMTYNVIIPIAGHITFEVEAESEEEAKELAWNMDINDPADLSWEMLETFGRGNVCYCPSPWSVEVEEV